MKITDVRIHTINSGNKLKAVASVTFDDVFVVHDIKVISGQSGLFIAMPSRKMGDGDFRDIAHPLNSEFRGLMKEAILSAYEETVSESGEDENGSAGQDPSAE